MRGLVGLLAACALSSTAIAGWVRVDWTPTPGVTALRSGCVAPGQYERPATPIAGASSGNVTLVNLPDAGKCYFALNAGPQDEWVADFTALAFGQSAPGAVRNLAITWASSPPSPPVSVGVTINAYDAASGEFDLVITGSGAVTLRLTGTGWLDWCKPGGAAGTTVTPTAPTLGLNNNDGVQAASVIFTAPVVKTRCDIDPNDFATFPGATATVGGLTKPLVRSGSAWSVSF